VKNGSVITILSLVVFLFAGCASLDPPDIASSPDQEITPAQQEALEMIGKDSELLSRSYQTALGIQLPFWRTAAIRNVAEVYSAAGDYEKAATIIMTMPDALVRAEALNRVSEEAWDKGSTVPAGQLLRDAQDQIETVENPHERAYGLALLGRNIGIQGDKEKAVDVLLQANEEANSVENMQQKAFDLTLIAEFLADNGEIEKSGEILSEAYRIANHIDDTEVRITTMDRIAYLLEKDSQYDEARDVEDNIDEAITHGAAPDRVAFYYLTRAQFAKAYDSALRIDNPYSKVYTLAKIGERAWKKGDVSLGTEMLDVAVETSEQIEDVFFRDRSREKLVVVFCQLGQPARAAQIIELLEKEGSRDSALQTLAWGYAHLGQYNRAADTVARIEIPRYKTYAYYEIGKTHLDSGRKTQAVAQFTQARQTAESISNQHLKDEIHSKIATAFAECDQPADGLKVAEEIQDPYYKETAWYNVADYYHTRGNDSETLRLADQMANPYYKSSVLTWQARRKDFS